MEKIIYKKEETKVTEISLDIDVETCFFKAKYDKIHSQVDAYIGRIEIDGIFYTVQWYRYYKTINISSTIGNRQSINKLPFQEFINRYKDFTQIGRVEFSKAYQAISEDYLINGKF
jgi:hypothetical protein